MAAKLDVDRFIDELRRANRESDARAAVDEVLGRTVSDPAGVVTGAIHVYGGDFFATAGRSEWDPETLSERPLDLEAARERFREANERFQTSR